MSITDGGINIPKVPPAARVPVLRAPEYPNRLSSGSATLPIVAAVASDDPQIAPNPAQAPIAAIATPPFLWPRQAPVNLKSASLIPALPAKFPINKNSGMTDKE